MTRQEAAAEQNRIAASYNLGWWFGTDCKKCCGVYPRFMHTGTTSKNDCFYQCDVCGKRTDLYEMPWIARDAWNEDKCLTQQLMMEL